MNGCELPIGITALAIAIAGQIEDINDLSLAAAAFTQLGDTLALIAAQRARCEEKCAEQEAGEAAEDEEA